MTCAEVQSRLSLYLYGELNFAEEEFVESHLDECAFCQLAWNREKEWHAALNRQQRDINPDWLTSCRSSLHEQIALEPTTAAYARDRLAGWWHGLFEVRLTDRSYRLAGISFLVLLGFGAGRLVNNVHLPWIAPDSLDSAAFLQPAFTQVQEIRPESGNRVRIIVQRVQVREVSGNRDDDSVRALLVRSARESDDPGVRMDSVEMLAGQTGLEIRDAIVNTIRTDPNAAVRVKAIESLRQFPLDVQAREALEFALAHDHDAGVRTEAMDVLVPTQGDFQVTPQLLQTISDVMQSAQSDDYVRGRCAQILHQQSSHAGH